MITQEKLKKQINNAIVKADLKKENLKVALKGAFKEYLFADENEVYIYKNGFMTGHLFGSSVYKLPYKNISSVNINYHLLTGYFEVSAGGVQNQPTSYWNHDDKSDPSKMPNAISLAGQDQAKIFRVAADEINKMISESDSKSNVQVSQSTTSAVDEIKKYKALLDDGVITKDEFNAKKKQLLGL